MRIAWFRVLCILLLLISIQTTTYGFSFNTSSNSGYRSTSIYLEPSRSRMTYGQPIQDTYSAPRIGYSTYRGVYQPKYNSNYNFAAKPIENYNSSYNSVGSGRPGGQPRRVIVYDGQGREYDTGDSEQGNPDPLWDPDYEYRWDGEYWWRTNDGGQSWEYWHTSLHLWYHWWGWWNSRPGSNAVTVYEENPVPLGDAPYVFMLSLLLLYLGYNTLVRPKLKK